MENSQEREGQERVMKDVVEWGMKEDDEEQSEEEEEKV